MADDAVALLAAVVSNTGGENREGQAIMAGAVADALERGTPLVVEAPTGVGKSYAVATAVAAWLAHQRPDTAPESDPDTGPRDDDDDGARSARVVITTATRALQDQLVDADLPAVAAVADTTGAGFTTAVLKGRSNYLCLARVAEAGGALLDEDRDLAERLATDARTANDGERSRLTTVDDPTWRTMSVTAEECPGAHNCSVGSDCWAEVARRRAATADVVVVNTALYATHLLADGAVLPDHAAVVIDEAHALADILTQQASVTISAGRLTALERAGRLWARPEAATRLAGAAAGLRDILSDTEAEVDPTAGDLAVHLADASAAASDVARAATEAADGAEGADRDAALVVAATASRLVGDLAVVTAGDDLDRVVWSDGDGRLACAPLSVADLAALRLWPFATVVATSATLRTATASGSPGFGTWLSALGAPANTGTLAVDSPFDHRNQGMLYVPRGRIPSPREDGWADGVVDELWTLVVAAGGRTLALFTSRRATERAAAALREKASACAGDDPGAGLEVLTQWEASRQELVDALVHRRRVVVCGTRSLWTGVDIPGSACVVVAIDRLPFPRPDEPLVAARRRAAETRGDNSFLTVDLPDAATQLAQGVGRLIRSSADRGVVAVLDTRLATARWRHHLLGALPPFRRSVDPDEVAAFLSNT